jgi:hypothetical protein
MPVILATQEAEIRSVEIRSQPRHICLGWLHETLFQKTLHKRELVEWLKV